MDDVGIGYEIRVNRQRVLEDVYGISKVLPMTRTRMSSVPRLALAAAALIVMGTAVRAEAVAPPQPANCPVG